MGWNLNHQLSSWIAVFCGEKNPTNGDRFCKWIFFAWASEAVLVWQAGKDDNQTWSNYSDLTRVFTPNGGLEREIPLFQGNLGWSNNLPLDMPDYTLTPDALKLWAMGVEKSVKLSIQQQHQENPDRFPQPFLPKKYLGRGKDPKISKIPPKVPIKQACAGQYTPAAEVVTYRIKMKTRQVRRLQSFRHRIAKVANLVNQFESTIHELRAEWRAITRAKGFSNSFPSYCLTNPHLLFYPLDFPTIEWLDIVIQTLSQDIDAEVVFERQKHRETSKFAQWYDEKKDHLQNTIRQVKQVVNPTLTLVPSETSSPATLLEDDFGLVTLLLSNDISLRLDRLITYAGFKAHIQNRHEQKLTIMFLDECESIPAEGLVVQSDLTSDPSNIADKLNNYWNQFWCRDSNDDISNTSVWSNFNRHLEQCTPQPPIELDLCNVELWKQAIGTTKVSSARGTDGWTVEELRNLPDVCIQVLANIFASIQGQSLPIEWTHSITIPIGKTDLPETPAQTRPITLIPMLYRWWTKVVTKQILKTWGQTAPPGLIGFLPTRSAQLDLVDMQWNFEKAHDLNNDPHLQWQGLTLDLVKCFNLLPRLPSYQAMIYFGVPKGVADIWFNTLSHNTRWWKIQNQIWCCGPSTTGTPEGDTWSVVACLALSWVWQQHVAATMAKPLSYADNWGWKTKTTASNLAAIQITTNYTDSLRLQIDWGKTWAWTTATTGKKKWEKEIKTLLPQIADLTIVTHARELGYMIHYNKVTSRETQMQRHLESLAQLKRLKRIPVSLDSKALICTYAMHKALYGTETYAVGQNWTKELRSAMAKAIVPYKQNSNPYLAVMMLSKLVIDPELYLIRQSLILCRKLLMQFDPSEQHLFLRHVAKHTGDHRVVRGPAGTLKFNLHRIGWTFAANGQIFTDTIVTFDILKSPIEDILKFLEFSWLKHVTHTGMARYNWRNFPVPNRVETLKLIHQLTPSEQKVASHAITGAYMMSNQSQNFTDRDQTCDLCDAEDSTEHRLMHCPQTNHLCHEYPELISFLQDHHPCHFEIPVIYLHDDFEFNWFFFANRPTPEPLDTVLDTIKNMVSQDLPVTIFTDGSCIRPSHPWHRRAAFSIILSTSVTAEQRRADVDFFRTAKTIPDSFHTLAVAECRGSQTIPRAELQAIAFVASLGLPIVVYTDSAYAIDVFRTLNQITHVRQLATMANFDITFPLWHSQAWKNIDLRKVKAHSLDLINDSYEPSWQKIGNEAADKAAKNALTMFSKITPTHADFPHFAETRQLLPQQFSLRAKQQAERAKAYEVLKQQKKLPEGALNFGPQLEALNDWTPTNSWQPMRYPADLTNLELCTWTTAYGDALLEWLTRLRWPTEPEGTFDVTWFEMAFAFQTAIQHGLIYNSGQQGQFFLPKWAVKDDNTIRYGKQVLAFERCVGQLEKLLDRRLVPARKANCTTILILGANHYRPGLICRPQFPHQTEINKALYNHFAAQRFDTQMTGPPQVPLLQASVLLQNFTRDDTDFEAGWHIRVARQRLFLRSWIWFSLEEFHIVQESWWTPAQHWINVAAPRCLDVFILFHFCFESVIILFSTSSFLQLQLQRLVAHPPSWYILLRSRDVLRDLTVAC